MFGYHVPAPNEALLISGRKQRGEDGLQFKIVTGHG
ncbi:MAG: flotillin, partial [Pseudonocardiales bacterium]|nr:flotillin [Pseudonocardiales bacterium]